MSAPLSKSRALACRFLSFRSILKNNGSGVTVSCPAFIARGHNYSLKGYSSGTSPTLQKAAAAEASQLPEDVVEDVVNVDVAAKSLQHHDYFGVRELVTVSDMFKARVHLGHKQGLRDPYMAPYLFGNRLGVDIFDLDQTLTLFQDALNFTAHIAYRGGIILFLTRHRQTMPWVERTAVEAKEYSHCRFWKGGTFTNAAVQFGTVTRLPDLCIFLNTQNNAFLPHAAITDSAKLLIPTVGIVDSNCDPRLITYPVPGNDDTPVSVEYYCSLFKKAILIGKRKRRQDGLGKD
ncbi:28S ribosomal protein S2, mitochondrial-like isoform X1 [Haliotis rufescens]|uniref:28S ribosomal protein S2, mitochondrial-like isoform X1 n=1 Tax=Haliotis rufescens TaxID=6454 RepID=UPI001EAFF72E|nr:28S ribosomal protein S2, mitochondrial-like isoform X1 [Haliotis rufescens]